MMAFGHQMGELISSNAESHHKGEVKQQFERCGCAMGLMGVTALHALGAVQNHGVKSAKYLAGCLAQRFQKLSAIVFRLILPILA